MAGIVAWWKRAPGKPGKPGRPGRKPQKKKAAAGRPARKPAKARATRTRKPARTAGRSAKRPANGWLSRFGGRRPARRPPAPQPDQRPPLRGVARGFLLLLGFMCMVGFAVVLAKLTLVPSPASVSLVHPNFTPGASIRAYVDQPAVRDTVKQIGGNVVLGMPFGLLLPVVFPRTRGLVRVVLVTAFVMLCVETAQGTMVEGRAFDIDDVILNTSGALLGYLIVGRRLGRTVHPPRRHWWRRRSDAASSETG